MTNPFDWKAAGDAAAARRAELGITQETVIERMGDEGVSVETYRQFEAGVPKRYRRTTLAAASKALGWPADQLYSIAAGRGEPDPAMVTELRAEIGDLRQEMEDLRQMILRFLADSPDPDGGPVAPLTSSESWASSLRN